MAESRKPQPRAKEETAKGTPPPAKKQAGGHDSDLSITDDKILALEHLMSLKAQDAFFKSEAKLWETDNDSDESEMDEVHVKVRTAARFFYYAHSCVLSSIFHESKLASIKFLGKESINEEKELEIRQYELTASRSILKEWKAFLLKPSVRLAQKDAKAALTAALREGDKGELDKPEMFYGWEDRLEDKEDDSDKAMFHEVRDEIRKFKASKSLSTEQQAIVEALHKKLLVALKVDELMLLQLKDARNIAFHEKGRSGVNLDAFELEGKASEDSQKDLVSRKPVLEAWLNHYLAMQIIEADA